jgi:hypothetical protein
MNSIVRELIENLHKARTSTENARFVLSEIIAEILAHDSEVDQQIPRIDEHATTIYGALLSLSPNLANSYAQIKDDLQDETRISWAGTAHEIREVLATMLRILAPDDQVTSSDWYVQDRNTLGPTQSQRVRFILQEHNSGSQQRNVIEHVVTLDRMIETLVRATYSRASDAAHRFKEREEVSRIFRYFEVFALDLLDIN